MAPLVSSSFCAPRNADNIYKWCLREQDKHYIHVDYMQRQTEINEQMRSILVDWLIDVHVRFRL